MTNVVNLPVITRLDLNPQRVLEAAMEAGMTGVVILGYAGKDDDEHEYFAASFADGGDVLWLLERLKMQLLQAGASP